jgi:hypothetical protein
MLRLSTFSFAGSLPQPITRGAAIHHQSLPVWDTKRLRDTVATIHSKAISQTPHSLTVGGFRHALYMCQRREGSSPPADVALERVVLLRTELSERLLKLL